MSGRFLVESREGSFLPGMPKDYLTTLVLDGENKALLGQRDVLLSIIQDNRPLPTTVAREGYFGERHLEYWLSGYRDAGKAMAAAQMNGRSDLRILDFGGASARVARHFARFAPAPEVYLSDINPAHVSLVQQGFAGEITALQNFGVPALPFADGFFDMVTAFSVFTHIHATDTAWLLELRRIVKPGGALYITVHDEHTWDILPHIFLGGVSFANEEFKIYREQHPHLSERVTHFYNDEDDYSCNVFLNTEFIDRAWAPLFGKYTLFPGAHDHQAGLVLPVG